MDEEVHEFEGGLGVGSVLLADDLVGRVEVIDWQQDLVLGLLALTRNIEVRHIITFHPAFHSPLLTQGHFSKLNRRTQRNRQTRELRASLRQSEEKKSRRAGARV